MSHGKKRFRFKNKLFSLDATLIELCISLFDWAKFRKTKGVLKLHYLYDHRGSIPTFLVVTDAKQHEVKVAKGQDLPLLPDSIISVDRAYIDYKWLYSLKKSRVTFVTRAKKNLKYEKYQTKYSYTLLDLSRMLSETILERISLIDLLSCKYYKISKIRGPDLQQALF